MHKGFLLEEILGANWFHKEREEITSNYIETALVTMALMAEKHTGPSFCLALLKVVGNETRKLVDIKDGFLKSRPVGKK